MDNLKYEPEFDGYRFSHLQSELRGTSLAPQARETRARVHESEDNRSSNALSTDQSSSGTTLEYRADGKSLHGSPISPAPICRQFWKAGNYDDVSASNYRIQKSQNYLHVHPKFLHSNATSHKWAFGAVAELIDNAIDEVQNGATFVKIDKVFSARDGSPLLLIQDDGGGMDPEAIRHCMSFGFSDKKSTSAIGRYGNGLKTSTMRLGADAIVFSRHMDNRKLTQSVGLLSYTYLSRTGLDRIVVPMVDYEYNMKTSTFEPLHRYSKEHFQSNISILLQWSPFSSELELMKQFDDIGSHGTKVIIHNLWFTDLGTLEFDFESDPKDIRLQGSSTLEKVHSSMLASEEHIANQYRYSLRVYLSILYLHIPENFYILLRGKVVEHHNIAQDLKFPEFILYKPQTGGTKEGELITTVGFLEEAPHVSIHGFNVYHKNRLILPFWPVVRYGNSRGRGVVGILEANFIEPIHNKQDFERTSLFQKLENRLKEMTLEYWDYHCGLIGYQVQKKTRVPVSSSDSSYDAPNDVRDKPSRVSRSLKLGPDPIISIPSEPTLQNSPSGIKKTQDDPFLAPRRGRKQARERPDATSAGHSIEVQPDSCTVWPANLQQIVTENKKLRAKCMEHERTEEELNRKLAKLRMEVKDVRHVYIRMFSELQSLEVVKPENGV